VSAFSTTAAETSRRLEQAGANQHLDGAEALSASLFDMIRELTPQLDLLTVDKLRRRLPPPRREGAAQP
jgi:hypothetical protein